MLPTVVEVSGHKIDVYRCDGSLRLYSVHMHIGYVLSESQVVLWVALISDQPEQIETREQSSWQLDISLS